jgi:cyclic pyranopterin phosphate synthase
MPSEGIPLSPKSHLMTAQEIFAIASTFVNAGVTKIRLTGGEPLVRKDAPEILEKLASLPVELAISTNAVNTDRYIESFKKLGINSINVSLDTLDPDRFKKVTRRDYFERVYANIFQLVENGFNVKLNCVLMKGFNEDEIIDFINLSKTHPIHIRFIEFMPFDGNKWDMSKLVSYQDVLDRVNATFKKEEVLRINDRPNDTSKNYQIKGYKGTFAIISTVTNPFCDSCNRIRLTANGQIKNCLFSSGETDLLTALRAGQPITPLIEKAIHSKLKTRGGMDTLDKFKDPSQYGKNRSMIAIGG